MSAFSIALYVYLIIQIILQNVLSFDIKWDKENNIKMPIPLSSQIVCNLNDTIYFVGGRKTMNEKLTAIDDVYMLNKSNNTFVQIAKIPQNAYFASNYICHNDSIYMFGPKTDDGSGAGQLWIFNLTNYNTTIISFPKDKDPVSLPCIVKNSTVAYIAGGQKKSDNSASNQLLLFNYTNNKFINITLQTMPIPLYAQMCHMINNTKINGTKNSKNAIIYAIGGINDDINNKDIFQYNTTSDKWSKIGGNAILNYPRSYTKTVYAEDSKENFIFIVGGGSPSQNTENNSTDYSFLNSTDLFYVGNYSIERAFGHNLTFSIEYNTVTKYDDKLFIWGFYAESNGTKQNYPQIFTFKLPNHSKEVSTWVTIGIIAGTAGFMFICGCISYIACARSKKSQQENQSVNQYQKYSK